MTNRACGVLSMVLILAVLELPTAAQPSPPPPPPPPQPSSQSEWEPVDPGHDWSVTLSPIHLIAGPIIEVTGERKLGPKLGAALMIGAGKFTDKSTAGVDNTFDVFELGASVRWYVFGKFERGVQLGGSAEYVKLSGDDINGSGVSAIGNGALLSPFIGYKHTWALGITFDAQFGPTLLAIRAESETASTEESRVGLNLNLNLGWSF